MRASFVVGFLIALHVGSSLHAESIERTIQQAREHLQKGRYDEAAEACESLGKEADLSPADRTAIALAESRIREERGEVAEAIVALRTAVEANPDASKLWARLGQLQFLTGDYEGARKSVDKAIELSSSQPLARFVRAELLTETGRIAEALVDYRWFVQLYNRTQPDDADVLLLVGEGSLQYARWKSVTSVYNFVVNTLCPDILKGDKTRWEAACLSGRILLEKYNRGQASAEFDAALKINPHCAAALAGKAELELQDQDLEEADRKADEALKLNPSLPAALAVKIDTRIVGGTPTAARTFLDRALAFNPLDQRFLARLAACDLLEDGLPPIEEWDRMLGAAGRTEGAKEADSSPADEPARSRFSKNWRALVERNPRPGYFLSILGEALEAHRKFDHAEKCYEAAIRVMPELSAPRTQLGMLYLRTGRTTEAESILNAAFKADPFHVRVSNLRKVIGVLKEYDTISTDHFVIRIDKGQRVLGLFMADYLEEVYADLVKEFKYEPPTRTQFEIYGDAKGQPAHAWFSARMIGLPWIQTIGASTGRIVALASPINVESPFNWAIVLKHEFVHVLTLQATQFQIPHWYTEALAVRAEGTLLRDDWIPILRERYPDKLFTLDTINGGFQRPKARDDWDLAYCQSRLYVEYLAQTYGDDAPARLLDAYRRQLSTTAALQELFRVTPADFEKGFREFVGRMLEKVRSSRGTPQPKLEESRKAFEADSRDAAAAAAYAYALMRSRKFDEAAKLAAETLAKDPRQPWAALVRARYLISEKKSEEALKTLEAAHDAAHPNSTLVLAVGRILIDGKRSADALPYLEAGLAAYPESVRLKEALAEAALAEGKTDVAYPLLVAVAMDDQDALSVRKRLAGLARDRKDLPEAIRWSREALDIDIENTAMHTLLARALLESKDYKRAERAWECLMLLEPDNSEAVVGRARSLIGLHRGEEAKVLLDEALRRNPKDATASDLRKTLD